MVRAPRLSLCCGLFALCSAFSLGAHADTFSQTGTFTNDDEVLQIPFSTSTSQSYTFTTTSYAMGGFDPVLSLFNSDGTSVSGTSSTNGGADSFLTDVLSPGSYILALTEFPNYSSGTLSSFSGASAIIAASCNTSAPFTDAGTDACSQRTANYTVNYSSSAVTPEPPSALLLLLPLGGVVVLNRRRLSQS